MKHFIREYFTFNKSERNGLIVMLFFILLMLLYLLFSDVFVRKEKVDFSEFDQSVQQFQQAIIIDIADTLNEVLFEKKNELERFPFNPNDLSSDGWKRLGFSDKQVSAILNYRDKGGYFSEKEDLKKLYVVSDKMYLSLEKYIQITSSVDQNEEIVRKKPLVELNTSDSATLLTINGIGSFYAKQIIKRRKELGGFVSKEQLLELWHFDSLKLSSVSNYISIDTTVLDKININSSTAIELKHPYLTWNAVNAICNYRSKHGNYKRIEDIKLTQVVDEKMYQKIKPYLKVE